MGLEALRREIISRRDNAAEKWRMLRDRCALFESIDHYHIGREKAFAEALALIEEMLGDTEE